jgi:hypothetical protein
MPFNLHIRRTEIPIGWGLITVVLFPLAGITLLRKTTAIISGLALTLALFTAFFLSEKRYGPKQPLKPRIGEAETERFPLQVREDLSPASLQVRPGNILVAVHDPNHLGALRKALEETDPMKHDIVVLSVNSNVQEPATMISASAQLMNKCETSVFTQVVHEAEKIGKPVMLVAIAGRNDYDLILQAAISYILRAW